MVNSPSERQIEIKPPRVTTETNLRRFAVFIELEKKVRHAKDEKEFGFLVVNETFNLVPYRQALLWSASRGRQGRVEAVSGLVVADHHAPFVQWVNKVCAWLGASDNANAPKRIVPGDLPDHLARDWHEWLPVQALWVPLADASGHRLGGVLMARDAVWPDAEIHLLTYLGDAFGHAWGGLTGSRKRQVWSAGRMIAFRMVAIVTLVLIAMWPVRQSVLAPAELVAQNPFLVRAPIEGVVDRIEVKPNAEVVEGDVLLRLDDTRLASRLEVARKALDVAVAEFRQASQQAVFIDDSRVNLAILRGRMEQQSAEVEYLQSLFDRVVVRAPRDGVVIFDDASDLIGKPVALGERIMTLADPARIEIEVHLPVSDAIELKQGAQVKLFLNTAPHKPIDAVLTYIGYEATKTPEGFFAFRLKAEILAEDALPRIGLKGTAKVYGEPTTLGFYIMRRPFSAVRQYFGV